MIFSSKNICSDVRFWIILFFVLRLFGITDPPLEVAHNWRQTTVTMPARNYLELDNNILYPRVDFAGEKTGITGMEFPLLNYLIYLVSLVFGYAHWYGRLINLVVSSLGLFYFYKIIKKYFSESMAFNASFILLFSIWFTYSRKIMPDTFSMSLVFLGFYYGSNYLDKARTWKNIFLYFIFVLIGVLSKLPSAFILVLFVPSILSKDTNIKSKFVFSIVSFLCLCACSIYYFYWVPHLINSYGFSHFFMGKSLLLGVKEVISDIRNALEKFYLDALQIIGFIIFLGGIGLAFLKRNKQILTLFGLSFVSFLLIMFKAGFTFTHHSYYIIPFAPIMAIVAASCLENIKNKKIKLVLLSLICIESLANKFHDFYIHENNLAMIQLEEKLNQIGNRGQLILINSGDVPTPMYFAHRKGWITFNENILNNNFILDLKAKGLRHIVILKRAFGDEIKLKYKLLLDNQDFAIYEI